jgi:hypothetical protein
MLTFRVRRSEELSEESDHGFGTFASVSLDVGKLGRQKVVEVLRSEIIHSSLKLLSVRKKL